MNRHAITKLVTWKDAYKRRPLLFRGARQVGKSYCIREFGRTYFQNVLEVNLEKSKALRDIFNSQQPSSICKALAVQFNQPIIPGQTLLFIDEIQESKEALSSLRYFFEEMPELHVIAAGSLLDMLINEERDLRMPVGRVEFCYLFPLSFLEFLEARGENIAVTTINEIELTSKISTSTHDRLLELFAQYIWCGGMPAVVDAFNRNPADLRYRQLQADIVQTYRDNFRKYRSRIAFDRLDYTFSVLPRFVGKNFQLKELCPEYAAETTRRILSLFHRARVINIIEATHANGLPLAAETTSSRDIKYILVDVGLCNSSLEVGGFGSAAWNLNLVNSGCIAEQVVGQELLAYMDNFYEPKLFFWRRLKPGSTAEVDYVLSFANKVIPIEVKAGSTGRLKSLRLFMQEKNAPLGVRVSQLPLSLHDGILSVPIYAVSRIATLVGDAMGHEAKLLPL